MTWPGAGQWTLAAGLDRACLVTAQTPPAVLCAGANTGAGARPTLGTTPPVGAAPTLSLWLPVVWQEGTPGPGSPSEVVRHAGDAFPLAAALEGPVPDTGPSL